MEGEGLDVPDNHQRRPHNTYEEKWDFPQEGHSFQIARESKAVDILRKWVIMFEGKPQEDPEEFLENLGDCVKGA